MAVPKQKVSKQRKHTRAAAAWTISRPAFSECPQCHELKANHKVCKACGYYDGKQIIAVNDNKETK